MFNLDDYQTLDQKLIEFWEKYPDGRIETQLIEVTETRFIVVCRIYKTEAETKAAAMGHAYEVIGSSPTNKNFALENAESSAIARAIGFLLAHPKVKRNTKETMAQVNEIEKNEYEKRLEKRRYSPPGSRAAAVEDALRKSFEVDSKQDDPQLWNVEKAVDAIGKSEPLPEFDCSQMKLMQGVSKQTGKPFYGYVCDCGKPKAQQCAPKWAKMTSQGNWYFPSYERSE
jgi:hypothetical protein